MPRTPPRVRKMALQAPGGKAASASKRRWLAAPPVGGRAPHQGSEGEGQGRFGILRRRMDFVRRLCKFQYSKF